MPVEVTKIKNLNVKLEAVDIDVLGMLDKEMFLIRKILMCLKLKILLLMISGLNLIMILRKSCSKVWE